MKNLFGREPAAILATIQTAIALIVAFGLDLSGQQIGALVAVTAAVLGLITRSKVTPAVDALERLRGIEVPLGEAFDEWEAATNEAANEGGRS